MPVLKAKQNEKWFVVNHQGKKVSKDFDDIYSIGHIEGNLGYVIAREGEKYVKRVFEME